MGIYAAVGQIIGGMNAQVAGAAAQDQANIQAKAMGIQGLQAQNRQREALLASLASIHAASAASGIGGSSGSVQNALEISRRNAARAISQTKLNTTLRVVGKQGEGKLAKDAADAKATGMYLSGIEMGIDAIGEAMKGGISGG